MRGFIKAILVLLVIFIAGAVAVPFLVPADTLKSKVLAELQARTGRNISIDHLTVAIFPTIAIDAENVRVGNPAWAGGGNMAEIKTLKLGLELMPLLHKQVRLKELTLDQPVLLLIKQHGHANWDFGDAQNKTAAAAKAPQAAASAKTGSPLNDLHLAQITIKNGSATYKDDASPRPLELQEINFSLKAPNLNDKAVITLAALYEGKKADIALTLNKPLAFQSGTPTDIDIKVSYGPLSFIWVGTGAMGRNGVPDITGKMTIPSLNTADLSPEDTGKSSPPARAASAPVASNASRWSDAPIHLDGLARINADLTLDIGTLTLPKTTLKDIAAKVRVSNGGLQLATSPINAYGGTITLALAANTAGAMNITFNAAHAEAEPLLHDFAGYDRLSGIIDMQNKLSAVGQSQRAIINSLSGAGNVHFSNGKLKGVNLAAMLRSLGKAQSSEDSATDFSELSGSYTIARGIVTNNDLKMNSPLLRMSGAGTADLPNWQEHFVITPTLVASLEGQGGKDASGITVPVDVDGPLDHPHYQPDMKAALQANLATLKDPKKLQQDIKGLKKSLLQGNSLQNLLR